MTCTSADSNTKKYEYHSPANNIALAIYRDEASAQKALDASPIRFALEKLTSDAHDEPTTLAHEDEESESEGIRNKPNKEDQGIDEILRPSHLLTRSRTSTSPPSSSSSNPSPSSTTASPTPMPFDPPPASPHTRKQTKWFQVTLDRSHVIHQDFIERQPFWKQFNPMKSMAQEDLAKQVPYLGLSDVSKRPPNAHRTPNKILRSMNEYVEKGMPMLGGIEWEERR